MLLFTYRATDGIALLARHEKSRDGRNEYFAGFKNWARTRLFSLGTGRQASGQQCANVCAEADFAEWSTGKTASNY
jgi:hypothetical protein